jgi:malonate decarboxylase beta subunit
MGDASVSTNGNSCLRHSYREACARHRILSLLDSKTFEEFLPPPNKIQSPHLQVVELPAAFDDGVIVGRGKFDSKEVYIAAQEGRFIGGAVGEVHGAKIVGILRRAIKNRVDGVLLLLDSGGVRLHEANAGLIAISEIIRAILDVRAEKIPVIALIGGTSGCFGGMGIAASCCDQIIISSEGRLGLSGPEVIETVMGVEEFDSRDYPLVWRVFGGKHRYLLNDADFLVEDDVDAFRTAVREGLSQSREISLEQLEYEQQRLLERVERHQNCRDSVEVWQEIGLDSFQTVPALSVDEVVRTAKAINRKAK